MGGSNMKTMFSYDHYATYDELTTMLKQLQAKYPTYMTMESICETKEKKQVWAVTITAPNKKAEEKPAYYLDGNHHAGEVTGSMACLHMIDTLLSNYETDAKIKQILDDITVYVIPKISPDGSNVYLTSADQLRSVNRNYPYEKQQDGYYKKDMNQDGYITMMRMKTPYGAWKKSKYDDRLMSKRLPDDVEGEFYHVMMEGEVQNFDGVHMPKASDRWGLDFNRNYPYGWFIEARQSGAGVYPLSNPENKAVADFVIAHSNICFVATMHTTGGVLVYPPGTKPSKQASAADMNMYQTIGKMATEEMGYPVVNIFDAFLSDTENYASGAFDDWCYHTQGIPAYTVELWNIEERAGCGSQYPVKEKTEEQREQEMAKIYQWLEKESPSSILPWKPFQHPQFGEVELGGIDFKFSYQNCPPTFLQQEVEKTTAFCLRNMQALPKLVIEKVKVNQLSDDIYQIKIVLGNKGYLPTYLCEEAKAIQVADSIQIQVEEDIKILQSNASDLKELEGFGTIVSQYAYDGIETDLTKSNQKGVELIVQTKETSLTLCVKQKKCGVMKETIVLNQ